MTSSHMSRYGAVQAKIFSLRRGCLTLAITYQARCEAVAHTKGERDPCDGRAWGQVLSLLGQEPEAMSGLCPRGLGVRPLVRHL